MANSELMQTLSIQPVPVSWHKKPAQTPELQALTAQLTSAPPDRATLRRILSANDPAEIEAIRLAAEQVLLAECGDSVRLRGLIEFSNRCVSDCYYCGIRRSNRAPRRYTLKIDEIVDTAVWCMQQGYGSIVLQSGERRDAKFVRFVSNAVREIKVQTRSPTLPDGIGITLCVGEQSTQTYQRWFADGAHRYLLRIESSSPALFATLHPPGQQLATRVQCLKDLKKLGYWVGSGVMIGLPGQTIDHLVDDLLFFQEMGLDMIGMGPYIPHEQAVLPGNDLIPSVRERFRSSLRMIAAARLLLRHINIAATTALQTLDEKGREQGLRFGANVIMPQATPSHVRHFYTLYDDKPCLDDSAGQCAACLAGRINSVGRRILKNQWGDGSRVDSRL